MITNTQSSCNYNIQDEDIVSLISNNKEPMGMAEKARILKTSLTNIFPLIEKQNVLLVLLNQITAEIGGWKPGITSSGGNALN